MLSPLFHADQNDTGQRRSASAQGVLGFPHAPQTPCKQASKIRAYALRKKNSGLITGGGSIGNCPSWACGRRGKVEKREKGRERERESMKHGVDCIFCCHGQRRPQRRPLHKTEGGRSGQWPEGREGDPSPTDRERERGERLSVPGQSMGRERERGERLSLWLGELP